MKMRKFILLAAVAALTVPAGAIAQQQANHAGKGHAQTGKAQHTAKANPQTAHSGQHTAKANPQTVHSGQHTAKANPQTVHNVQHNTTVQHTRTAYVAPVRNWSYRPVSVGYRLQPSFYGSRYYITDYSAYHLRAPGRDLRWIRYGNDLLLVNIHTGRVIDVIHYAGW
jgi:Ni/Co efflux regulator RcnB